MNRVMNRICLVGLLGFVGLAGCNWLTGPGSRVAHQGVMVRCDKPTAVLWVDERIVGRIGDLHRTRIGLKPGAHRLAIRLPGHFTRYLDVQVKKGRFERILVKMVPELD